MYSYKNAIFTYFKYTPISTHNENDLANTVYDLNNKFI